MPIRKDKLPEWTPHLHIAICLSFSLGFWWHHHPTLNHHGANNGHVVMYVGLLTRRNYLCYSLLWHSSRSNGYAITEKYCVHTWPPCEMMPYLFVTLHWCGGTAPHRSVESVHNHPERRKIENSAHLAVKCSQVVEELDWKFAGLNTTRENPRVIDDR